MDALAIGKELPETELQPADDLILLAAQAFVGLWESDGIYLFSYLGSGY